MWWRALPVVIAITCTFQTEIKAEFDDVMCVLLLSGLKKEDMDDVLLKKLEQHNINVDDMNNEENIEKCILKAKLEKTFKHLSTPAADLAINTQYESQATPEHFNITTINTVAHEFNGGNTIKENIFDLKYGKNGFKYENEKVSMLYSINNAMNLWKYINKVKPVDEKISTKVTRSNIVEVPTNLSKTVLFHDNRPKGLENIKKIIGDIISAKQISTTSKPTTEINIDKISQQVLQIVENNNNNYKELMSQISAVNGKIEAEYTPMQNPKENNDNSISYINALLRQTYLNMQSPPDTDPKQYFKNYLGTTQINMPQETTTTKLNLKPIQGDIIKEITEQIKKSVLEDFQKQMLSTLEITTDNSKTENTPVIATTTISTTKKLDFPDKDNATAVIENFKMLLNELRSERQIENKTEILSSTTVSHLAQDKIKDTANILQNLMEILNQLKSGKDGTENVPINYKSTKKVTTNQFHGPINVVYPPPIPFNNLAYNIGTNAPTVIPVNPHQPFLQINNPVAKKTNIYQNNPKQRIAIEAPIEKQAPERLTNYYMNPVNTFGNRIDLIPLMPPIIQTDALEVPPIGIPVPKTVRIMNQNIVITTQHPMVRYNEEQQRNRHTRMPDIFQNYAMRNDERMTTNLVRPDPEYFSKYGIVRNYDLEQPYAQRGAHASLQNNGAEKQRNTNIRPLDFQQFYKEYMRQINNGNYRNGPQYSALTQNGRYHEQLETPQEWQIYRDKKTRNSDLWKRDFAEYNQKKIENPNEWQKYSREHEKRENTQLWKRDFVENNENKTPPPMNEWQKHFRQMKLDNSDLGPRDYRNRDERKITRPKELQKYYKDYVNRSERPNTWQRDYTSQNQKRPDEWKTHFMDHQTKLERPDFWLKDVNNENKFRKPVEWHKYYKGHQNVSDNASSQTNHENYDKNNNTENVLKSQGKHHVKSNVKKDKSLKVASRQQLSMQDLKNARYDDTHFQKFLKTQQKVNDMLENILATKEPEISVETPDTISMYIS